MQGYVQGLTCFSTSSMWLVFWLSKRQHPSLEIPLKENIKLAFMENLANFKRTQVEGGKQKNILKGKHKSKEKGKGIPSSDVN